MCLQFCVCLLFVSAEGKSWIRMVVPFQGLDFFSLFLLDFLCHLPLYLRVMFFKALCFKSEVIKSLYSGYSTDFRKIIN